MIGIEDFPLIAFACVVLGSSRLNGRFGGNRLIGRNQVRTSSGGDRLWRRRRAPRQHQQNRRSFHRSPILSESPIAVCVSAHAFPKRSETQRNHEACPW